MLKNALHEVFVDISSHPWIVTAPNGQQGWCVGHFTNNLFGIIAMAGSIYKHCIHVCEFQNGQPSRYDRRHVHEFYLFNCRHQQHYTCYQKVRNTCCCHWNARNGPKAYVKCFLIFFSLSLLFCCWCCYSHR